jgi:hypothetical protein
VHRKNILKYRVCPTRYRTRHFFNNFTTNVDIAKKFEAGLPHCVRKVTTTNVLLFKFRCNIFTGVRIIKEKPGSVASGTPVYPTRCNVTQFILSEKCRTCFGLYHHPSSGAHTTVSTASDICHAVTATCHYSGR